MILDDAIHVLALTALVASLFSGRAFIAALLIFSSLWFNDMILVVDPKWSELVIWCVLFAVKDLLILTLLGFRRNTAEFILLLSFAVSCLFHQAILAQVLTYDAESLTLFSIRPDVMKYVSVCQLATVFYILFSEGGVNGGKRVKYRIPSFNGLFDRLFHTQAFKVTK